MRFIQFYYCLSLLFFGCNGRISKEGLKNPRCACNTILGGYGFVYYDGECQCDINYGVFGCIIKVSCSPNVKYKKTTSMGNSVKWEKAMSYFMNSNDILLNYFGKEMQKIKYQENEYDSHGTEQFARNLNLEFDSLSKAKRISTLDLLKALNEE